MTVEYVLLLVIVVGVGMKVLIAAPTKAFQESAPRLALRVEKQLMTGQGFDKVQDGTAIQWEPPPQ